MATELKDKQGTTGNDGAPDSGSVYDDQTFSDLTSPEHLSKDGISPNDLKNREESAGSPDKAAGDLDSDPEKSLYNPGDGGSKGPSRIKGRLSKLAKNRLFVGGAIFGSTTFVGILIMGLVLIGSLKIPHLLENITGYQFARVTRQMARSSTRITSAKIVVDSADKNAYQKYKEKYVAKPSSKVAEKWAKLDKYRPQKIINNFDKTSTFKFNYVDTDWGKQRLVGITVAGDRSIPVQRPTGLTKFLPGVKFVNDVRFASKVAPVLQTALKTNNPGFIIRGSVAKQMRQRAGISLVAWKIGEFKGKSAEKARLTQLRSLNSAVDDGKVQPSNSEAIKGAAEKAKAVEQANIKDDARLLAIAANDGVDEDVLKSIDNSLKPSLSQTILGTVSQVYAIAAPLCIIYDGSIAQSGPTINAQSLAQEKTYYYVAAAADQQKNGYDVEPEAVGALNDQLGDITGSEPERRASGVRPNTSNELSTQASAGGNFTVLDVLLPKPLAKLSNDLADQACPTLTSIKTNIAFALINVAAIAFSGGSVAGVETGVNASVQTVTRTLASKLVANFTSRAAAKASVGKSARFLGTNVKSAGVSATKIGALTILAKYITIAKMNSINNGLQTNTDLANAADSGGNLGMNNISREQFFGIPLTKEAVVADASMNQEWTNSQQSNLSMSDRYIALSNPNSFATKFAYNIGSYGSVGDFARRAASTITSLPKTFSLAISGNVLAAENITNQNTHYGNIQWGLTAEEENLLANDPSYSFLDNQLILDASGFAPKIAVKYAKCWGYNSDEAGSITPGGPKPGDLIADGSIIRDDEGNVLDDPGALCSKQNLSIGNREFGDNVFRWRIANTDENTINALNEAQDPVKPSAEPTTPPPSGVNSNPADIFGPSADLKCTIGQDGGIKEGFRKGNPVPIRVCILNGIDLNVKMEKNIDALLKDAKAAGIDFTAGGFRTMAEQTSLYNQNCSRGDGRCNPATAEPGFSNHQMGLAFDFIYQGQTICFKRSSANCNGNRGFDWLQANAANYGLKNLPKEAWHWSVDGT